MRTAEEIIKETFPDMVYRFDGLMQGDVNANDIRKAMQQYAKEAIEECARVAQTMGNCTVWNCEGEPVNKQSILRLIDELK